MVKINDVTQHVHIMKQANTLWLLTLHRGFAVKTNDIKLRIFLERTLNMSQCSAVSIATASSESSNGFSTNLNAENATKNCAKQGLAVFHKQSTSGGGANNSITIEKGDSKEPQQQQQELSPEMAKKYARTGDVERAGKEMR